ncbi:MAG: CHAT domain-containing protein [Cyanobacteria bacterium P01_F01_bin.53]
MTSRLSTVTTGEISTAADPAMGRDGVISISMAPAAPPPTPETPTPETPTGETPTEPTTPTLPNNPLDNDDEEPDDIPLAPEETDILRDETNPPQRTELSGPEATQTLKSFEQDKIQDFSKYFGRALNENELTVNEVQALLSDIEYQSGNRLAVVHLKTPQASSEQLKAVSMGNPSEEKPEEELEMLLITTDDNPVKISFPDIDRTELLETIRQFRNNLVTSVRRGGTGYLPPAQQLYQWLIAPMETEFDDPETIDTLVFVMDEGLRALPVAALHDGEQFLVEKYSLGVVPSLGLLEADYVPLTRAEVLVMGASDFEQLSPLPAVPLEIDLIHELWPGEAFLNERFTRENLIEQRSQSPFQLIHLATHAEFNEGSVDNSYIQLWDEKLRLSDLHQLDWHSPAVDLLVLSACSTAVGSVEAEMGFAGLSVASGVRSAMASLWAVDDLGTLALMNEFYRNLRRSPLKVDALRTAQLAMLQGDVRNEDGELKNRNPDRAFTLPSELETSRVPDFSHPYYWSGFTMIGSPW